MSRLEYMKLAPGRRRDVREYCSVWDLPLSKVTIGNSETSAHVRYCVHRINMQNCGMDRRTPTIKHRWFPAGAGGGNV